MIKKAADSEPSPRTPGLPSRMLKKSLTFYTYITILAHHHLSMEVRDARSRH